MSTGVIGILGLLYKGTFLTHYGSTALCKFVTDRCQQCNDVTSIIENGYINEILHTCK